MNILTVFLVLISFVLIGYSVILFFDFIEDKSTTAKLSIGYALGVGFVSFELFIFSRIGIKWDIFSIYFPWAVFVPLVFFIKKKKIKMGLSIPRFDFTDKFFALMSATTLFYTAFESVLRPLSAWDGFAIWLVKSKMFFIDGFVNPAVYFILRDSYPYVINLAGTFIYEVLGKTDDTSVLLLFFGFYIFLFLIFFSALKEEAGIKKALIFSFLLISTQNIIRHGGRFEAGYVDLALGYYIFISYYLFQNYIKNKRIKDFIFLQIILGITSLIKVEGLVFCLIMNGVILYTLLIKQKKIKESLLSFLWIILPLDWQIYKTLQNINFTLYENPHLNIYRIPSILYEMGREFINIQNWNLLWIVFFLCLIVIALKKQLRSLLLLILTSLILVYFFVFIISPNEPYVHVRGVFNRLLLHIAPLAVYLIAISFKNTFNKNEK